MASSGFERQHMCMHVGGRGAQRDPGEIGAHVGQWHDVEGVPVFR